MSDFPAHFVPDWRPLADPAALVIHGAARFSVLSERLIRCEYSADGIFEDRPSQPFWYRQQPVPPFSTRTVGGTLTLETAHLTLTYRGGEFGPDTLLIGLRGTQTVWRHGDAPAGNLSGTARTLDAVSGATELEPGLLSRDGWVVVDDSRTLLFGADGWPYQRPGDAVDFYFFGHGHDYAAALRDYRAVGGQVPLIPRYMLGNWWSRYHAYTQAELQTVVDEFAQYQVPLAVCIIDMDWHIVSNPHHNGWTGYTWNNDLFPDPDGLIAWLHARQIRTALNLHPAAGVAPHEAAWPTMAARLGIRNKRTIPLALGDPQFVSAYFEELHHPQEARGVDFWWLDWQQGNQSDLANLDPLWWLNHLHFLDLGRDDQKRPAIFSRWGGLGTHRTPIGFSGDAVVTWESLAFQPYFTATAANVAYGWWSHDIGGHMGGIEEPELYTRWVQFGVLSPILRLHSTKSLFHERRPWGYDTETARITSQALRLRHALIPYLYALAWRDHAHGEAPVRPLYHTHPNLPLAYERPQQYWFGPDLIAAPFVTPRDRDTRLAQQTIWLPDGLWYDFFSGDAIEGGRDIGYHGALDAIPLLARAGAIVPLASDPLQPVHAANPDALTWRIFAGDGTFALYEDDGTTTAYQHGDYCLTPVTQQRTADGLTITFDAPQGNPAHLPARRTHHIQIDGIGRPIHVAARVDGRAWPVQYQHDGQARLLISPIAMRREGTLTISVQAPPARPDRRAARLIGMLRHFRLDTGVKNALAQQQAALLAADAPTLTALLARHKLKATQRTALHDALTLERPLTG